MRVRKPGPWRIAAALLIISAAACPLNGQGHAASSRTLAATRTVSAGEWMEVTQGVQDARRPLPLVGGRTTWVRVYPVVIPAAPAVLRGLLRVQWAGGVDTVPSMGRAHLSTADAERKEQRRGVWTSSLNFLLPPHVTGQGRVWLELIGVTDAATGARVPCPDCGRSAVEAVFGPPRVLRVKVVGFRQRGNGNDVEPREQEYLNLRSWLWRAYPVSRVVMETVTIDAAPGKPNCDAINTQLVRLRALDVRGGQDPRTRYYGMLRHSDAPGKFDFMRGCSAGIPMIPDPAVVAAGSGGIPYPKDSVFAWDEDGSDADWYGGHEIGHTFGLRHPGWCFGRQEPDDPYAAPEDSGRIGGRLEQTVGLDPLTVRVFGRDLWHDMMTYCPRQWVGARSYLAILKRLMEEDSLHAAGAWPRVAGGTVGGAALPMGDEPLLQVVVRFSQLELDAGAILAVVPVAVRGRPWSADQAVLDTISPALKVLVEVAGRQDTVRADGWVMRNSIMSGAPRMRPTGEGYANVFLPNVRGPARITVYLNGKFVHFVERSANAPALQQQVRHTLPRPAVEESHQFRWALVDEDDFLNVPFAYVQVTWDGGGRWHTIQQTWRGEFNLPCATLAHRGSARIRLIASDGINTALVWESDELVPACRGTGGG